MDTPTSRVGDRFLTVRQVPMCRVHGKVRRGAFRNRPQKKVRLEPLDELREASQTLRRAKSAGRSRAVFSFLCKLG
jgi:hypothetical protein